MSLAFPGEIASTLTLKHISDGDNDTLDQRNHYHDPEFGSEAGMRSQRSLITTATLGEWNVVLTEREAFVPIDIASSSMVRFFQTVLGRSIFYNLNGIPEQPAFEFSMNALVLSFSCLRGSSNNCIPWPVVSALAQFLLQRVQLGSAERFVGNVRGDNGVIVQVALDVVTVARRAAGQAIMDSASEIHGH